MFLATNGHAHITVFAYKPSLGATKTFLPQKCCPCFPVLQRAILQSMNLEARHTAEFKVLSGTLFLLILPWTFLCVCARMCLFMRVCVTIKSLWAVRIMVVMLPFQIVCSQWVTRQEFVQGVGQFWTIRNIKLEVSTEPEEWPWSSRRSWSGPCGMCSVPHPAVDFLVSIWICVDFLYLHYLLKCPSHDTQNISCLPSWLPGPCWVADDAL